MQLNTGDQRLKFTSLAFAVKSCVGRPKENCKTNNLAD